MIFELSPMPNQITISGRNASGGIGRSSSRMLSRKFWTIWIRPTSRPSRMVWYSVVLVACAEALRGISSCSSHTGEPDWSRRIRKPLMCVRPATRVSRLAESGEARTHSRTSSGTPERSRLATG